MNAPHLLLVTQQMRSIRSGVGTYARVVTTELLRRGIATTVATWDDEVDREHYPAARWIELGTPTGFDPTPGAWVSLGRTLADRLAGRDGDFDLVHFFDAREAWAVLRRGRLAGTPKVSTIHDDYAATAPRSPLGLLGRAGDPFKRWAYYTWLRGVERRCYRRFDLNMVNAAETGRAVAAAYDLDRSRLRTIRYALAPREVAPEPEALAGEPAVLFAGGNYFRKGLDVLVRAVAELRPRLPGVRLHVAGRDPRRRRIEKLATQLGVGEALVFHGLVPRERMERMMAGADVFCMPSRREAQGFVYLEAMREGTPVVSCDEGGVTDIVRDGETGLTVAPEDPRALAAALARVVEDAALRERIVAGGRAEVASRTPEALVARTLEVYEEALGAAISDFQPM